MTDAIMPTGDDARFTGAQIKAQDPERWESIRQAILDGCTVKAIMATHRCSDHTVRAARNELINQGLFSLDAWKKNQAAHFAMIATQMAERLERDLDEIPTKNLPLAVAILTDKALALAGQPTAIVEHRTSRSHGDINQALEALEAQVLEAEVVEDAQGGPQDAPGAIGEGGVDTGDPPGASDAS